MSKISRHDLCEETIYGFVCPSCESYVELGDEPDDIEDVTCEHCGAEFELSDE